MKTVAYLRVSLARQDLDHQRRALLEYAHRHQVKIDEWVQVQCSSRREPKERGLPQLLAGLQPGDTLLVSELSRLGRSVGQIAQTVDELIHQQIQFVAIKEDIHLNGPQDLRAKVMVTLFSLFAEIERDLISERTREGLAAARARGKVLGRPPGGLSKSKLDGREEEIRRLLGKKVSQSSMAQILGVSRTALVHFIRTRGLG